jgi:hypothetical protein
MDSKGMINKEIISNDVFLDMPLSAQVLYFHLALRVDEYGCINNPKALTRAIGCKEYDLERLLKENFVSKHRHIIRISGEKNGR